MDARVGAGEVREGAQEDEEHEDEEDELHPLNCAWTGPPAGMLLPGFYEFHGTATIKGMMRIATMFVILIIGLIAGPAVSL